MILTGPFGKSCAAGVESDARCQRPGAGKDEAAAGWREVLSRHGIFMEQCSELMHNCYVRSTGSLINMKHRFQKRRGADRLACRFRQGGSDRAGEGAGRAQGGGRRRRPLEQSRPGRRAPDIPKATVSRLAATLVASGYLRQATDTERFSLGPALLRHEHPLPAPLRLAHRGAASPGRTRRVRRRQRARGGARRTRHADHRFHPAARCPDHVSRIESAHA